MRQSSEQLKQVLSGSFTRRLTVDVFHGSDRVATGLAFTGWSLNGDLGSEVCYSGAGTVVVESVNGERWAPEGADGVLSPFRARFELMLEVSAGDFSERVSLGSFRVTKTPSMRETTVTIDGAEHVVSSEIESSFLSLDEIVRRAGFEGPVTSPAGASVWGEVRRFAVGLAVEESVPDVVMATAVTWEAAQGGRLKAIHALGRMLGGTMIINGRGAFTLVPDEYTAPVGVLRLGTEGTVTEIGADIDTDGVYNVVVGSFEDANRNPIYATARVRSGPLAYDGTFGANVRYYSSDFVKTQAQADSAVNAVLAESIDSQMYDVRVQCHINPLVEIGDVWEVDGWSKPLVGRVVKVSMSDSELMTVTLRAKRVLS